MLESPTANTGVSNQALIFPIRDPLSPTGFTSTLLVLGGNQDLKPERASTWTAGVDFHPDSLGNLSASFTYFNIDFKDRILAGGPPGNILGVLLQEDIWADIITRNPSRAQVDEVCGSPLFTFGDCSVLPGALVDLRLRNLAQVEVRGLDASLTKAIQTQIGEVQIALAGTYVFDWAQKVTNAAPLVSVLDTVGNPLSLRARASLSWDQGPLGAGFVVHYANDYRDNLSVPDRRLGSWTTLDGQLSYAIPPGGRWYNDLKFGLNAVNLLNKKPPFVDIQFKGYDSANAELLGRILSAQLTKQW